MNQGTEWGLLMKKNRSQKSRASVPLSTHNFLLSKATRNIKAYRWTKIQQLFYSRQVIENGFKPVRVLYRSLGCKKGLAIWSLQRSPTTYGSHSKPSAVMSDKFGPFHSFHLCSILPGAEFSMVNCNLL
jgi:hypothetical protein